MKPARPRTWSMAGLVALVLFATAREATCSVVSSARGGHRCECGTACRGSSCCCPHEDREAPLQDLATPPAEDPAVPSGPCLKTIPCGGAPGLPAPSIGVHSGKAALHRAGIIVAPGAPGTLITRQFGRLPSNPHPSRLDRPPRD